MESEKAGEEKRRTWHKLHLAVDVETHKAISAEVSLVNVGDSEVLPTLLTHYVRKITAVSSDGAYDTQKLSRDIKKERLYPVDTASKEYRPLGKWPPQKRSSNSSEKWDFSGVESPN